LRAAVLISRLRSAIALVRGLTIDGWGRLKAIHLQFIDKDGFPTAAYDVAIGSFVRIYSSNEGRLTSLEARGTLA
jgi:hypothetical protein